MKLVQEEYRLAYIEEDGHLVGEVTFPRIDGIIQINHTFVDEAYRGQGIAGRLLDEVVKTLRERGEKALPVCAYSISYFAKHPENQDVVRR